MSRLADDLGRSPTLTGPTRVPAGVSEILGVADTLADSSNDRLSVELGPGKRLGRFSILEKVGEGGMGAVFSAYDPSLDRKVAIKLLRPLAAGEDHGQGRERMLREARAMARVSHPNVLVVYETGVVGEQIYLVTEFAGAGTLGDWLREGPRGWQDIVGRFVAAGRGLAAAHEAGLVHRDFKPENVLLTTDGRVLVADFGLVGAASDARDAAAKESDHTPEPPPPRADPVTPISSGPSSGSLTDPLTQVGQLVGTPTYMAPEQLAGAAVDARADQFAFCVALYRALYGDRPFRGDHQQELLDEVMAGRLRPAPEDSQVPARLFQLIRRGLSGERAQRFASMGELITQLVSDPSRTRRRRLAVVAIVAAFAGLIALAARGQGATERQVCSRAGHEIDATWSPERRRSIEERFIRSGRPYGKLMGQRVADGLDGYTASWARMRRDACEATHVRGVQSGRALDLRMRCLDRRRAELDSFVVLLASADAAVTDEALSAVGRLEPIEACGRLEGLESVLPLPTDAGRRAEIGRVQAEAAEVRALLIAASFPEALRRAVALEQAARATRYPPLHAEVLYLVAWAHDRLGDPGPALAALHEGLARAAEAHDDALSTAFLMRTFIVVGSLAARPREAFALRPVVEAALLRVRAADEQRLEWLAHLQTVQQAAGDYLGAVATYELALPTASRMRDDGEAVAKFEATVAGSLYSLGRYEEAEKHARLALAIFERRFGPEHPRVIGSLTNLGMSLDAQGRRAEARQVMERGLAVGEATLGELHPDVTNFRNSLGALAYGEGRWEDARTHFQTALDAWQSRLGPEHTDLAYALVNLGEVELRLGRVEDAERHYRRALELWQAQLGPDYVLLAHPLAGLAQVALRRGRPAQAVAFMDRSLAILAGEGADPVLLAKSRAVLLAALEASGQRGPRLRDLREELARFRAQAGPEKARELDELVAELGARPR